MLHNPQIEKLYVSWEMIQEDTKTLCHQLAQKKRWTRLVAIARGGLIPATLIASHLDIRWVDTVCIKSRNEHGDASGLEIVKPAYSLTKEDECLIIDELADTGQTLRLVRETFPKATVAVIYGKKQGLSMVDFFVREVPQSQWVVFPWEAV